MSRAVITKQACAGPRRGRLGRVFALGGMVSADGRPAVAAPDCAATFHDQEQRR
jgi:hypothetical protein